MVLNGSCVNPFRDTLKIYVLPKYCGKVYFVGVDSLPVTFEVPINKNGFGCVSTELLTKHSIELAVFADSKDITDNCKDICQNIYSDIQGRNHLWGSFYIPCAGEEHYHDGYWSNKDIEEVHNNVMARKFDSGTVEIECDSVHSETVQH
jgi:hypothetical protein